jgi:cobalt-zinc-cadmium efflux system protein
MSGHGRHDHGGHAHGLRDFGSAFAIGAALNVGYVALEATFGILSGSLALLADAGHNLSDVLGLLLAWAAASLSGRAPSGRRTYGFKRTPILASLANAVILLVAVGAIVWEAVRRILEPQPVATGTILWVAALGVVANGATAWLFWAGRQGDINVRATFLHMVADAGVTVGVVVAALLIRWTGWEWLDPAISLLIAAVILFGTWGLLRDSVDLALDAVPPGIELEEVRSFLAGQPGVAEVHDLHVWPMSTTETALTVHLVRPVAGVDDAFLDALRSGLHERFGIDHPTVQLEAGDPAHPCPQAPAEVV